MIVNWVFFFVLFFNFCFCLLLKRLWFHYSTPCLFVLMDVNFFIYWMISRSGDFGWIYLFGSKIHNVGRQLIPLRFDLTTLGRSDVEWSSELHGRHFSYMVAMTRLTRSEPAGWPVQRERERDWLRVISAVNVTMMIIAALSQTYLDTMRLKQLNT